MVLGPGSSGNRFTPKRKEIYFSELRRCGEKQMARICANVSEWSVKDHRKKHPEFAEAESDALVSFNMELLLEAKRRGVEGVAKPVTVAGKKEMIRDYSDRLLLALLKAKMPEFRDRVQVDQTVEHSGMLSLEADLRRLTPRGQDLLLDLVENELAPEDTDDDVPEEEAGAE